MGGEHEFPIVADRDFQFRLEVADVDDVGGVVVDRADRKISFLIACAGGDHAALHRGSRIDRHGGEFIGIALLDAVEIAGTEFQARAVTADIRVALQDDRLEGVGRHAGVVAVDEGRVVALASGQQVQVVHDPDVGVELAEHGIPFLARGEEQGAIGIVPSLEMLRGVTC